MMIRSMAPQVVAVDEIGTSEDIAALSYALTSGCSLLATIHGETLSQVRQKKKSFRLYLKTRCLSDIYFWTICFIRANVWLFMIRRERRYGNKIFRNDFCPVGKFWNRYFLSDSIWQTAYIICRTVKEHFLFYREKWNTGTRR